MKRRLFLLLIVLLFWGCSQKSVLSKRAVADMVSNYYTPYSSTNILVPQSIDVQEIKQLSETKAVAKVCYEFRFLTSYEKLVRYMKEYPNSFLARFDVGLVALLGRKFGHFVAGDVKRRCDEVVLEKKSGKWSITQI
ncbi:MULTISPECIES: hypothetical protein [unclassified Nitratiruptor]|uniref:hypothetical protein n=1 Tax=unclassified Nitratiruptor TaxID=2624044 RepID=UPI00191618CB|nr:MULTISPECIES: hypothetical protein [unclassified Nitratiruptor]BCD59858.1 hypothetical protein NitYY0810_C0617 [Nitratiruptor sp. YY08-10]BCD63781.1 hypothetical protein NitYY0814_C0616 [Nitratiruptor sp. YY08-14]